MATLGPTVHGKSKKQSSKLQDDPSSLKGLKTTVFTVKDASLQGKIYGGTAAVLKRVASLGGLESLKVSLTTFRADDEIDQLNELIKSNTRLLEAHQRHFLDFQEVYASSMYHLVEATKAGVSPKMLSVLSSEMGMPKEGMADRLGLASSTVRNKTATSKLLSIDDSEKVIGMSRLIGQVQAMVNEAGNPEGFDAAAWLANWMEQGLPALGGRKPSEYMDTAVGQALVSQLLDQIRSGAYA